ncbi:fimbrial protein [Klebsiella oxytoca]|uniref:fimbrial protein n=1 Tax=Klebsiella oxytoca TaxID=571 RepID=UPI0039C8D593
MMKITTRLLSALRVTGWFIAAGLGLILQQAQAATCGPYNSNYYENFQVPVIGPNISTIGEDIAVGAVIYSGAYHFAVNNDKRVGWRCEIKAAEIPTTYDTYVKADVISMPFGAPTFFGDKAVYPTNVAGIGVTINVSVTALDTWKYPDVWHQDSTPITTAGTMMNFGYMQFVRVQLIKTGPISVTGIQQVLSSSFPIIQLSVGATAPAFFEKPFMTINFGGAMTIHTKTCQLETSVIDVELGSHKRDVFTGVGSGTEWKNFDIVMKDCPPFYGYSQANSYEYSFGERLGQTNGSGRGNYVAMRFTSVHGLHNARTALLESGPDTAEGIGIEIARRGDYTYNVSLNGISEYSIPSLSTSDGATYIYPLRARYVQYASDVKGGVANGAVMFTINYQ